MATQTSALPGHTPVPVRLSRSAVGLFVLSAVLLRPVVEPTRRGAAQAR